MIPGINFTIKFMRSAEIIFNDFVYEERFGYLQVIGIDGQQLEAIALIQCFEAENVLKFVLILMKVV